MTRMGNQTPYRLYRNPQTGLLAGVCAGIADYFGIDRVVVRIVFVIGLFLAFVPVAVGYVVLALVLKPRPAALYESREEEAFWRGVATEPEETLRHLKRSFADLEARLRAMEKPVVSGEIDLRRKFRDLGA